MTDRSSTTALEKYSMLCDIVSIQSIIAPHRIMSIVDSKRNMKYWLLPSDRN